MASRIIRLLTSGTLCVLSLSVTGASALAVVDMSPSPNYLRTSDAADATDLVDGQLNPFPFWKHRKAVGWQRVTPVWVSLTADMVSGARYRLRVQTGQSIAAGVKPPRQIDVYCEKRDAGTVAHIGVISPEPEDRAFKGPVDLHVDVPACDDGLLHLVFHAHGWYVMLDEISLERLPREPGVSVVEVKGARIRTDVVEDSRMRLASALKAAAERVVAGQLRRSPVSGSESSDAWLAEAWTAGEAVHGADALEVTALPGLAASYVVGVANHSDAPRMIFMRQEEGGRPAYDVFRMQPVMAADGQLVLDPIMPVAARSWRIKGKAILWLYVVDRSPYPGERQILLEDDAGWQKILKVNMSVLDRITPQPIDNPQVNVWAYTFDMPIWGHGQSAAIVDELSSAGVNVFVIPPYHLPLPFHHADEERRLKALRSDLELFKDRGVVLFFLGRKTWQRVATKLDDPDVRDELRRWIKTVADVTASAGVDKGKWALYPVDEARSDDLKSLSSLIRFLREQDPELRFYANPMMPVSGSLVRMLADDVDYWQPRAGGAHERVSDGLGREKRKGLWLYDNPCEPAKSTRPQWYRALAHRAHRAGAAGYGFWSFSDTGRSSAWDDFDGLRPDWAVAYEGEQGVVRSRRWEAFKTGVAEYSALRYCARMASTDMTLASQCRTLAATLKMVDGRCSDRWRR